MLSVRHFSFIVHLIRQFLIGEIRQQTVPAAISPIDVEMFNISKKLIGSNTLRSVILDLACLLEHSRTDEQMSLYNDIVQVLDDLLKDGFVLKQLACKPSLLQDCLAAVHRATNNKSMCALLITNMYHRLFSIETRCKIDDISGDLQQFDLQHIINGPETHHTRQLVLFVLSKTSAWTNWLHSQMLSVFLNGLIPKFDSIPEQAIRDLLSPVRFSSSASDHGTMFVTESYSEILCDLCHQFADLRKYIMKQVSQLVEMHTMIMCPNDINGESANATISWVPSMTEWEYEFEQMCIIAVQCCKVDQNLTTTMASSVASVISNILSRSLSVSFFSPIDFSYKQQSDAISIEHLQKQIRCCLGIVKRIVAFFKTVPFELLRTLSSLLSHRLSQVDLCVPERAMEMEYRGHSQIPIHNIAHSLLCELHSITRLHKQVTMFYESRKEASSSGDQQEPMISTLNSNYKRLSNWKVYEEYASHCSNCKSGKHGTLTPLLVNARATRRTHMLFGQPTQAQAFATVPQVKPSTASIESPTSPQDRYVGQKRSLSVYLDLDGSHDMNGVDGSKKKKKKYM